jgi:hypothetical protein
VPPATGPALIILVAFALPGFVTVLIQERTYLHAEDPTTLDRLLRVFYYSVWSYLILAVVALALSIDRGDVERFYREQEDDPAILVCIAAALILGPSLAIATATRLWHGSRAQRWVLHIARVNERHQEPTAWDFFFRQGRGAYVRVTFKDGGRVYGYYGNASFSAYAKDGPDLFLERHYADVHDWFGPEAKGTCGVWIKTQDVVSVEFYSPDDAACTSPARETSGPETPEGNGAQTPAAG